MCVLSSDSSEKTLIAAEVIDRSQADDSELTFSRSDRLRLFFRGCASKKKNPKM